MKTLSWKQWVRITLAVMAAAVLGLFVWNVRARDASPQSQVAQRDELRRRYQLLSNDVRVAADIRNRMPEIERQCDRFLNEQLQPLAGGYSAVVEDLNRISDQTGLRTRGVQYKQKELAERGVAEVEISATVEGGYANLVRFINELERSKHFYLLEELALVESNSNNAIRLSMQLKTYFRLRT